MMGLYGHGILNLLLVLAVMVAAMYAVKKLKLSRHAQNRHIKIINSVAIGGKEKLLLVEVNNAYLLIGATPNHIETLHVFDGLEQEKTKESEHPSFTERYESLRA